MPLIDNINAHNLAAVDSVRPSAHQEIENIEDHPAWHGELDINSVSQLLVCKTPFSYILTHADAPNTYWMSYMRNDGMVTHAIFSKDTENALWKYRNLSEFSGKTLSALVCRIMHCNPEECRPLSLVPASSTTKA